MAHEFLSQVIETWQDAPTAFSLARDEPLPLSVRAWQSTPPSRTTDSELALLPFVDPDAAINIYGRLLNEAVRVSEAAKVLYFFPQLTVALGARSIELWSRAALHKDEDIREFAQDCLATMLTEAETLQISSDVEKTLTELEDYSLGIE